MDTAKKATWLSALSVVGGILATSYQLMEMRRQDSKQEALTASLMGAMQDEQKFLREELHQLRLELYATQERLHDLDGRLQSQVEHAEESKPDGSGGDTAVVKAVLAPPPPPPVEMIRPAEPKPLSPPPTPLPTFPEMRAQAAQGKVWREGQWCNF